MLIAFLISLIARIFMPQHVVLVNQKMAGYWVITKDMVENEIEGKLRVVKFEKCRKDDRAAKTCNVSSMYVNSSAIHKKKLLKSTKQNWQPNKVGNYWVERKRDPETKMAILHFDGRNVIMLNLLKKEINVYSDTTLIVKARKLR